MIQTQRLVYRRPAYARRHVHKVPGAVLIATLVLDAGTICQSETFHLKTDKWPKTCLLKEIPHFRESRT